MDPIIVVMIEPAQRLALPAGGWDEITLFTGTNFKRRKQPKNAQTPTSRVHAVLGAFYAIRVYQLWALPGTTPRLDRTS